MKKLLIFIFVLAVSSNLWAMELDLSYNYSKTNDYERYLKEVGIKYDYSRKKLSGFTGIKLRDIESGSSFLIGTQLNYDLNDKFDLWTNLSYRDNSDLGIDDRVDFKVGAGYRIINDETGARQRKLKISYGLIYRDLCLLHSFRLKDNYSLWGLGYEFYVNYILPNGDKEFNELDVQFKPYVQIFNLQPSFSYNFIETSSKSFFETKLSLNIKL